MDILSVTLGVGEQVWPAFVVLRRSKVVVVEGPVVVAWPKVASRPSAIERAVLARKPGKVSWSMAIPWDAFLARMPERNTFVWGPKGWVPKKLFLEEPLNGRKISFHQRALAEAKRALFMRKSAPELKLDPKMDVFPDLCALVRFLVPDGTVSVENRVKRSCTDEEVVTEVLVVDSITALELFGGRNLVIVDKKVSIDVDEAKRRLVGRMTRLVNERLRESRLWEKAVVDMEGKRVKVKGVPDHLPCFIEWKRRLSSLKSLQHRDRMMTARWANTFPEMDLWSLVPERFGSQVKQAQQWNKMTLGSCKSMGSYCVVDIEDLSPCQKNPSSVVEWARVDHKF